MEGIEQLERIEGMTTNILLILFRFIISFVIIYAKDLSNRSGLFLLYRSWCICLMQLGMTAGKVW